MLFGANLKAQDDAKIKLLIKKTSSTMTLDQLTQHRAALLSYANSDEFRNKIEKIEGLKAPNDSGITSVDNITNLLSKFITKVNGNRAAITSMYTGVTGLNLDGTQATGTQADPEQLKSMVAMFAEMSGDIATTAKSLVNLPAEIKGAGIMKGVKGLKSLLFIKNAVSALSSEIKYNNQLTQNLMATQRLAAAAPTTPAPVAQK